ncbi:MAG: hypothetical protein GEV09_17190 [Pseudonocardiaceae bacterium]|nr:hypothetical protein [Pseudonocardiaceae bacterium]
MNVTTAALVLAWICLVLLVLAMAGLLRQIRELQADVAGLSPRGRRPVVGRQVSALAGNTRTVLLVLSPGCPFCQVAYRMIAEAAEAHPEIRFEALAFRAAGWDTSPAVPLRVDEQLFADLDVPWAPALLAVDPSGIVVSARPVGSVDALTEQLRDLLDGAEPLPGV